MTIANRIRLAMKQMGVTSEAELHRLCGLNQPTLHRILSGESRSPRYSNLEAISTALGTSPTWLLEGDGALVKGESQIESTHNSEASEKTGLYNGQIHEQITVVPLYHEVESKSGNGQSQVVLSHVSNKALSNRTLREAGVRVENAACASVSGNSMSPVLPNGATVGVNTVERKIIDGKIFAINHNGMLRITRIYRIPGGGVRLSSFNKDEHSDEEYDQLYVERNIRILGRVFWYESLA